MKAIPLTRGKFALVDDCDYELVSAYKWNAAQRKGCWYAQTSSLGGNKRMHMHRLLMGFPAKEVDHINGNGLDNRRDNLRLATRAENTRNTRGRVGTSQFKGVSWSAERGKWFACIGLNGKTIPLGRFSSESEAARAYDVAAKKYFGEFARVNNA